MILVLQSCSLISPSVSISITIPTIFYSSLSLSLINIVLQYTLNARLSLSSMFNPPRCFLVLSPLPHFLIISTRIERDKYLKTPYLSYLLLFLPPPYQVSSLSPPMYPLMYMRAVICLPATPSHTWPASP